MVGSLILTLQLAAGSQPEQPVEWTNRVNATVTGETLKKTAGCEGCEDAGAVSWQMIPAGDGYVEFTVGEPDTLWGAGLNSVNESTWYNDIDFAFRFNGNGKADVIEGGAYQPGDDITYKAGDVFRVAIVRGRIQYLKNGGVVRESRRLPRYPIGLDVGLTSAGASLTHARIAGNQQLVRSEPQRDRFASLGRAAIAGEMIAVTAAERWIDTGLIVQAGDALTISAEGKAAGALVARIGNAAPLVVGNRRAIPRLTTGGRLFLGISESTRVDNSGAYRVDITLQPK